MKNNLRALAYRKIETQGELSSLSTKLLLSVLIVLLVAPSFLMAIDLASSQAIGTSLAGFFAIGTGLLARGRLNSVRRTSWWLPFTLVAIVIHLGLASLYGSVAIVRALASLLVLTLFVLAAATLEDLLLKLSTENFFLMLHGAIKLLLIVGAWGCVGVLQPFGFIYPKPVFPFNEPSHFALALTPFLISACAVSSMSRRILYIGFALAETALLQNLTMAIGCFLAAVTCLQLRYLVLILIILIPVVGGMDLDYYLDRINFFNQETTNLSALVYLQGWQMLSEAFEKTQGIGVGFQQLGVNGSEVDAALIIQKLIGDDQNLLDGGMTISKLISEFGALGMVLLIIYLAIALKAAILLRSSIQKTSSIHPLILYSAGSIVSYLLEIFVRGAGYFTPGGLLALTSMLLWIRIFSPFKTSRNIGTYNNIL